MKVIVRFMSVRAPYTETRRETFANTSQALYTVTETYAALGFKNFKIRDDGDYDGGRITATTPGGRGGYNVAHFDYDPEEL